MTLPPYGLCLPCKYRRCRDGDTVEISVLGADRIWAIRLIDCWAPDRNEPGFKEAKAFAEEVLQDADHLSVYVPAPRDTRNLLANLTFDRVPGWLFVGTEDTLNAMMVHAGHATEEKRRGDR